MQRARRLTLVAVLALTGVSALAGCRSQPAVAAYVGRAEFTNTNVQKIVEETKNQRTPECDTPQRVVSCFVIREAGKRLVAAKGWTVQQQDRLTADSVLQQYQLPASMRRWAELYADFQTYVNVAIRNTPASSPNEQDVRDVYTIMKDAGVVHQNTTFEEFQQNIGAQGQQTIAGAVAVRDQLRNQLRGMRVHVNPRYAPVQYVLVNATQGNVPLIMVDITDPEGNLPVSEVPSPAPAQSPLPEQPAQQENP